MAILVMTFVFECVSTATAIYSAVYAYRGFVISKEGLDIARDVASSAAASASSASLANMTASITSVVGPTARAVSRDF